MSVTITVIVEDSSIEGSGLRGELGLSLLIKTRSGSLNKNILFDTGPSKEGLLHNLTKLEIDPASISSVVISHGHYDHAGGLLALKGFFNSTSLYVHPDIALESWRIYPDRKKRIDSGIDFESIKQEGGRIFLTKGNPMEIFPGALLSGLIHGLPDPRTAGVFTIAEDGRQIPDPFRHEQFLLLHSEHSWSLISGCCHHGIKNTLAQAQTLLGEEPIKTIVGGLHTKEFSDEDLDQAWESLRLAGVERLVLGHCTGTHAVEHALKNSGMTVESLSVGMTFFV